MKSVPTPYNTGGSRSWFQSVARRGYTGMVVVALEQALFLRRGNEAPQMQGRSPGFGDAWVARAEEIVRGFGERPAGVACPSQCDRAAQAPGRWIHTGGEQAGRAAG